MKQVRCRISQLDMCLSAPTRMGAPKGKYIGQDWSHLHFSNKQLQNFSGLIKKKIALYFQHEAVEELVHTVSQNSSW